MHSDVALAVGGSRSGGRITCSIVITTRAFASCAARHRKDAPAGRVASVSRIGQETCARMRDGTDRGKVEKGRLTSHMRSLPSSSAFHLQKR